VLNIRKGVLNGSIPSIVADSAATLNVSAKKDKALFLPTGRASNKVFQLPDGTRTATDTISELPHEIHQPTKDIHIVPTITKTPSLASQKWRMPDTSPFLMTEKSACMMQE
jgi:hypothetical protein